MAAAGDAQRQPFKADVRRQLDRWCDEFEARWRTPDRPSIADFLSDCEPAWQTDLLSELLALELDYRLERGEAVSLEEYLTRFGGQGQIVRRAFANHPELGETQRPQGTRPAAKAQAATSSPSNLAGARVGKYELLAELGRGGMGVVYQARQLDLGRLVAVKMLLAGPHAQPQDLDYFRREAEAVAQLQHPNIVQVFEVGDYEGLPYFSLEFVPGGPLSRQLDGTPQGPDRAAEWMETLARALEHAHERGVIHRDLKPGNVLLATDGTLKITDFGLAKRLDSQSHTVTGSVLGTPSYMAPEQAAGNARQIGATADVYGLGAILYELLTGRPPFKGETPWDTLAQVLNDDPVPPTRLQPKVPRDLETICLKCLHKDPSRRYATSRLLAQDLARFRAGEPIQARAVTSAERVWKWARRRPAIASLAAAFALAVVVGLIATTTLWVVAENRRVIADQTARRARQEIREHLIAATQSPEFQRSGVQPAKELVLRRALEYFRDFAVKRKDDPELQADVADAYELAGRALSAIGDSRAALAELRESERRFEQLVRSEPANREWQSRLGKLQIYLAEVEVDLGEFKWADEALAKGTKRFSDLAKTEPQNTDHALWLAKSRRALGMLQHDRGQFLESLVTTNDALQQHEQLRAEVPNIDLEESIADCLVTIGHAHWRLSQPQDALAAYERALPFRAALAQRNPVPANQAHLARVHGSIGQAQADAGNHDAALAAFEQALKLREALVAANPNVISYQYDLALSLNQVTDELDLRSEHVRSLPLHERKIELMKGALRADPQNIEYANGLATAQVNLGNLYRRAFKRYNDAELQLQSAILLWRGLIERQAASPVQQFALAQGQAQLAMLYLQTNQLETAIEQYDQSNGILRGLLAINSGAADYRSQLATNDINCTYCLQQLGRMEEALRRAVNVLLIREQLAEQFPQIPEHAQLQKKTREDFEASLTLYISQAAPLGAELPPADRLAALQKRLKLWQGWSDEFPSIDAFRKRGALCREEIAPSEAAD